MWTISKIQLNPRKLLVGPQSWFQVVGGNDGVK